MQWIALIALSDNCSVLLKEDSLRAGGSNINANHIGCTQAVSPSFCF